MKYRESLKHLIALLYQSHEDKWASYFNEALNLFDNGKRYKSYEHVIGAYGGMGSFNDITLNSISKNEYNNVLVLRDDIYEYSIKNRNIFFSWLGK